MSDLNVPDEAERKSYWTAQLELGYAIVEQLLGFPVAECEEGLASLPDAANGAGVEIRFSDSQIAGQLERLFFIRESLVADVLAIGREMNRRGWILKIEDAFRTMRMQSELGRKPAVFDAILKKCVWENGGELPSVEMFFRRACVMVANIPKVGTHMSASAIDISVFRRDDTEVWRGGPYLEVSERTPMRSPFISTEELRNREIITDIMESYGFIHFPSEFWHYNKGDALAHLLTDNAAPARYGPVDWEPETNSVTAIADPLNLLNPLPVIEAEMAAALARAQQPSSVY
jgi:zinc D-Ala-D-Ala dipeptidase